MIRTTPHEEFLQGWGNGTKDVHRANDITTRTPCLHAHKPPVAGMLVLAIVAGIAFPGCVSVRGMMFSRHHDPMAGAPRLRNVSNPNLDEVVAHLNQNTDHIQSWRANNVKIHANQWSLSGTLAVEKGQRVRLVVNSPLGTEVDLGSNDERFWVWSRRMDPAFVTCRHENMETARHQLGVPFEPNWLMQALGVSPLPTTGVKMEVDPSNHQARLVEEVVTAHGQRLRRAVLVDLKSGIVLEHSLYDSSATRVALAKLSGHRLVKTNRGDVVLPHRVLLDWPQNQMSLTMDLGKIQINPESIPSQVWQMPELPGYQLVNLDAGIPPGRIAIRPESAVRLDSIETARPSEGDEEQPLSEEPDADSTSEPAGRARLSEGDYRLVPPKVINDDDEWAK